MVRSDQNPEPGASIAATCCGDSAFRLLLLLFRLLRSVRSLPLLSFRAQIILLSQTDFRYNRSAIGDWHVLLLPDDMVCHLVVALSLRNSQPADVEGNVQVITIDQAVSSIELMVRRYYGMNSSVDRFEQPLDDRQRITPVKMVVTTLEPFYFPLKGAALVVFVICSSCSQVSLAVGL